MDLWKGKEIVCFTKLSVKYILAPSTGQPTRAILVIKSPEVGVVTSIAIAFPIYS